MEKTGVIYCFHCIFSGKKYIGKSINISKRLASHRRNVKNNVITKFYTAVKKYGWEGFVFGIMEECNDNILNEKEIFYIEKYKTLSDGYNMTSGGDGGTTWIPTDEAKEKHRERMKNFKHTDEAKKKISESNTGKKRSEETKKNLSKKLKGKKGPIISKEGKMKLSLERKGIPRPKEVVEKMIKTKKEKYTPQNHSTAKTFIFTSPNGEEYIVTGEFKKFCEEKNLSHWGMRNIIRTGKIVPGCKNWSVRRGD
jgi:group I intron endonuclease